MQTTAITLDRTRDYGTVHGEDTGGAFFAQDGFHFDYHGNLIESMMDADAKTRYARRLAQAEAERRAKEAYEAAMTSSGFAGAVEAPAAEAPPPAATEPPPAADDDGKLDLRGWFTGAVKYQWFEVTKALRDQHQFIAKDKAAAAEFLSNELEIPLDAFKG